MTADRKADFSSYTTMRFTFVVFSEMSTTKLLNGLPYNLGDTSMLPLGGIRLVKPSLFAF